ncbi:Protein kinase domain [Macleaya cordata]|uniref:Protein kinase domain n=1 Tax=Macleaya cordata TaxID=56857 RepID=A0A200QID6_MACCD|nr:Protein kinase domain [Macleaya cordata]
MFTGALVVVVILVLVGVLKFLAKKGKLSNQAQRVHNSASVPSLLGVNKPVTDHQEEAHTVHHNQNSLSTSVRAVHDAFSVPVVLRMGQVLELDHLGGKLNYVMPQYPEFQQEVSLDVPVIERFLSEMGREKPIRFTPKQLQDFTWNYSVRLGAGGFGIVYEGQFPNGVKLAVKVLNNSSAKGVKEQFMAEVSTIGRTYHKNLVRLYGFCFDSTMKALVYEFMENGSLDRILFSKNQHIKWEKLYEIAVGTAKGLAYLHEDCQKRIIHYDIKPGNILLDSNFSPKVADFGLAKLSNRDSSFVTMTGGRGTPGYAAPELWMPFPITYKCDVYSYGMMLFEIVGRRRNLDLNMAESHQWFPRQVWEKYEKAELDEMIINDFGITEKDRDKVKMLALVALWCVQYSAEARPSMSDVVKILEGSAEVTVPPNPFLHLGFSSAASAPHMKAKGDESVATERTSPNGCKNYTTIMKKYEIEMATSFMTRSS